MPEKSDQHQQPGRFGPGRSSQAQIGSPTSLPPQAQRQYMTGRREGSDPEAIPGRADERRERAEGLSQQKDWDFSSPHVGKTVLQLGLCLLTLQCRLLLR